jgi:acyl-homoserine lactone acylase PvdQ
MRRKTMSKWIVEPEDKDMLEHWEYKVGKEESTFDTNEEAWEWYEENADGLIDEGFGDVEVIEITKGDN